MCSLALNSSCNGKWEVGVIKNPSPVSLLFVTMKGIQTSEQRYIYIGQMK